MILHEELRKYRTDILKLSQEEAVRRLHMSQTALSFYETGKRQMTIDTLLNFKKAYAIPDEHIMKMLFGEKTEEQTSPTVLREHSREADLQRVVEMLEKNEKLLNVLVSLSYASEKTQTELTELLPHLLKYTENR